MIGFTSRFWRCEVLAVLLIILTITAAFSARNTSTKQGTVWTIGGELNVASGGELDIESGGAFKIGGVEVTATAAELNSLAVGTTLNTLAVGGGYGSTGLSVAGTGALTSNSTAQFDGVITSGVTGSNGGLVVKSTGAGATTFSVTGATGATAFAGDLTINTNKAVITGSNGNLNIGPDKFTVAGATGNTAIVGTLTVTDAAQIIEIATSSNDTNAINAVTTATYYGKTVFLTFEGGVTVTLPDAAAVAAGTWMRFVVTGSNNTAPTFQETGADDIIAPNNATADSVTYASGHRIGATVKFLCNGTSWIAINENAGCTMTVTDAG